MTSAIRRSLGSPAHRGGNVSAKTRARGALEPLASSDGVICTLALDHRDAMRNVYKRAGVRNPSWATMMSTKLRIAESLGGSASSILLDPDTARRYRAAGTGLIVPLEAQGHLAVNGGRLTRLMEDFSPADAAALGAGACKLLLYYRHDHGSTVPHQRELLEQVVRRCHDSGIALVVEPLVYRLSEEGDEDFASSFGDLVVRAARDLAGSGADLLKLQFPGDAASCELVSDAVGSVPWALLGGSNVDGDEFSTQLALACRSGARGFMTGRAIWGGVVSLKDDEQAVWLDSQARPLFERLVDIATSYGGRPDEHD